MVDRIAVDVQHLCRRLSGNPCAARRTHIVKESERLLSVPAQEHSGADPLGKRQLPDVIHLFQQNGERVRCGEYVVRRRKSVHVHLAVESGRRICHRRLDSVQESVEELTRDLICSETFLVQVIIDLFAVSGCKIIVFRVPERLFDFQCFGNVTDDVAVAEVHAVHVVEPAVIGMKCNSVEPVHIIRIFPVQLIAPADDVHAEVSGYAVAEHDGVRLCLFDRLIGVFAEINEPFRMSVRRTDEEPRLVAHFPYSDIVFPGVQDKIQIAVIDAFDGDHEHRVPVVLCDRVPLCQMRGESVLSFFEHLLYVRPGIEAADQTEDRFDAVFLHHPDCVVERIFAEFSRFRFGRAPVSPDPADRLPAEPHVAERLFNASREADERGVENIHGVEPDAVLRVRSQSPAGREARMLNGIMNDRKISADPFRRSSFQIQINGECSVEIRLPESGPLVNAIRLAGQCNGELGDLLSIVEEPDADGSPKLFLLCIEKRAESHFHRLSGAVERFDFIECHGVLLLRFCRSSDAGKAEVVQIKRVDVFPGARHDPDAVKIRISLDFEAFGKSLPFVRGTERKSLEHRIVFVTVSVGIRAEIHTEQLIRRVFAVFVRSGFGVERDFHFAGFADVKIFQGETVGAESPVTGEHHAFSWIASIDRDRIIDSLRICPCDISCDLYMFEFYTGNRTVQGSELCGGIVVDRSARRQQSGSAAQQECCCFFHLFLL